MTSDINTGKNIKRKKRHPAGRRAPRRPWKIKRGWHFPSLGFSFFYYFFGASDWSFISSTKQPPLLLQQPPKVFFFFFLFPLRRPLNLFLMVGKLNLKGRRKETTYESCRYITVYYIRREKKIQHFQGSENGRHRGGVPPGEGGVGDINLCVCVLVRRLSKGRGREKERLNACAC